MLSPDGHTRPFDAEAQRHGLRRRRGRRGAQAAADALADGDTIHAVIRGAAVNNDGGDKASFTAPSVEGQADVIARRTAVAGVEPRTISYVEAHGTARRSGDPIEVEALTRAFRVCTGRQRLLRASARSRATSGTSSSRPARPA